MCGSDGCSDSCSQVSAFRRNPLSLRLFDSHCHPNGGFDSVHSRVCILATEEADWPLALSASRQCADAVVGLGVHPWFAHRTSCGWVERLRDHLLSEPHSIVGEIGLDKAAKTSETQRCEYGQQQDVFLVQLALAAELRRPASVHCVKAAGRLLELLKQAGQLPPALALHSWSGDPSMVRSFLALPTAVYFGFSVAVNGNQSRGMKLASAKLIPEDRILIETDLQTPERIDASLDAVCSLVAAERGWSIDETAARTYANAQRFATCGKR
jgi:TatD DNase family protein